METPEVILVTHKPKAHEGERKGSLDLIRSLAIFCVVVCHVTEKCFSDQLHSTNTYSSARILALLLFTIGRLGVPLFLFLTGYLCLSKDFASKADVWHFYRHNLLPIVVESLVWIAVYYLFIVWFMDPNYQFSFDYFLFHQQTGMVHMWYIGMIIGTYFFIPFISVVVKKFSFGVLLPALLAVIVVSGRWVVGLTLPTLNISVGFFNAMYGIYIILGYYVKTGTFRRIKTIYWACLFLLMFVMVGLQQILVSNYSLWYDNGFLLLGTLGLFICLEYLAVNSRILEKLSRISFLIFFLHNPILILLCSAFANLAPWRKWIICLPMTFILSVILALGLDLWKNFVRWRIGRMRPKRKNFDDVQR